MRRRGRAFMCPSLIAVWSILAAAAPAAAAPDDRASPDAAQPTARRVKVVVRGDPSAVARVGEDVTSGAPDDVAIEVAPTDAIDLAAVVGPGPGDGDALASIWIDLAAANATATLVIVDGPRERVLIRHIAAPHGVDAVVLETVATIVASSIEALRAGARIGIERDEAAASLAAETAEPPRAAIADANEPAERPWTGRSVERAPTTRAARNLPHVQLEGGWRLGAWANAPVVSHGPSLAIDVSARGALRPGGGLSGGYRIPVTIDRDEVVVRVDTGSLRAWAGITPRALPRLDVRARLGGGLDLLRVAPRGVGTIAAAGVAVRAIPIVQATLGVAIPLPKHLGLAIDLGVDVDLVDTRLVLRDPARVVFDPWRARPWLAISLTWDALSPIPP